MITGRNKRPVEDHFDRAYELEEALTPRATRPALASVRESAELATMHYVRQGDPKGLGHAVLCAEPHVGDEPFAVLLGDDLIDPRDPLLDPHDRGARAALGGSVRGADGGRRATRSTCTAAPRSTPMAGSRLPGARHRPGREAASRRRPVQPRRHRPLRARPGGLRRAASRPRPAAAARSSSPTRCGSWPRGPATAARCTACCSPAAATTPATAADYLRAIVRLACERDDLGPDFRAWLRDYVEGDMQE